MTSLTQNLFAQIQNNVTKVSEDNVRTPMTEAQVTELKAKLKEGMALNVFPNQYDAKKPYRVRTRYNQEFTNYGNFTNLEVAKMVGNIASLSLFGKKALSSTINDMEAVQKHPEMVAWMADERNQAIIAAANLVYA